MARRIGLRRVCDKRADGDAIKAYIRKSFFASPRNKDFPTFWVAISPLKRRGWERLDFGPSGL
jgi:hypothetical protein